MTNLQVLLLIAGFLTLTVGSFIWYIATWDASKTDSLSRLHAAPALALVKILPPEAPADQGIAS